jgi:integrase/recombinase XerD
LDDPGQSMNKVIDIHNYQRTLERLIERISDSSNFSSKNKETALNFRDELLSQNISISKTGRYLQDVIWLNKRLSGKDFEEVTKEDIKRIVGEANQEYTSEWTKKGIKIFLKKFYKFIRGTEGKGKYPPEVNWFSVNISGANSKIPEELLTEKEMSELIKNAKTDRDKALMSILCESGCRVGEIGSMQIRHISFEIHGAKITVEGKTGMRKIPIIRSAPLLQAWLRNHPSNESIESPLWVNSKGTLLCYARIVRILKECSKKAGIKKRVYPHLLRHSRATITAKHLKEAEMKHYFGWAQSSKMAGVYVHLSGRDIDNAILKMNGINVEEDNIENIPINQICSRCSKENSPTDVYCGQCSLPLNEEKGKELMEKEIKKIRAEEIMEKLMLDEEVISLLRKKLIQNS